MKSRERRNRFVEQLSNQVALGNPAWFRGVAHVDLANYNSRLGYELLAPNVNLHLADAEDYAVGYPTGVAPFRLEVDF